MSDRASSVIDNFLQEQPAGFQRRVDQHREQLAERLRTMGETVLMRIRRASDELRVSWPAAFPEQDFGPYLASLSEVSRDFEAADALVNKWRQAGRTALDKARTLAEEIEVKYHSWESAAVEPMVQYACLMVEPPIYAEALPVFTAKVSTLRTQYDRLVVPIVSANVQRYLGMFAARQLSRLKELATGLADQSRTMSLAIEQVEGQARVLSAKYGVTVQSLRVMFSPSLPLNAIVPTNVSIVPAESPATSALEGS